MLLLAAAREELGGLHGDVVGVGPVVAAARAATLLERLQPSSVLMIGTGGAYPGGPPVGSAIAARRIGLSYGVAAMGLGYVPRAPAPIDCDPSLLDQLDLPRHNVLTVGAVTTDATLAERLSDGYSVEHLEAYSVAIACKQASIPFAVVLGISNTVGTEAHTEWLTHAETARVAARKAVAHLFATDRE